MSARPIQAWLSFASLSFIFFVVSAGAFSSLGVVLPKMVAELGWNWKEAGFGYTLLGLACGFASVIPAMLIRRIGVRWTLGLGALAMIAGFSAMAMTHSVLAYLAATGLIGLSFALVSTVPGTHVLTDLFADRRSTVLGAYFTIGALGGVAGPLFYVVIDEATHAWRPFWWAFVAMAAAAGLFAILSTPGRHAQTLHNTEAPEQAGLPEMIEGLKDWTVRRALATPQFYVVVGGYTTYLLINTTAHGFAAQHLIEHGVSGKSAAQMLAWEQLFGAGISVVAGALGERISTKTLMAIAMAALAIGMAALAQAHGWALMWIYVIGVGLGFGISFIASTVLLLKYFGRRANLELFSIMCLISTSAALGPFFGGWARDTLGSFSGMFLLCAGVAVVLLVATLFLRPPTLDRAASPALAPAAE
ncbi:MAG TPA: MFS transporter [Caulobacteraceae bacterium]|nr:MFS transporter [Caulobacteraceae bacterium]